MATLPILLAACLLVAQVAVVGYSAWSAASAARAGARALLVGAEPGSAARAALPGALAGRAEVEIDREAGRVAVGLKAPRLLPLIPAIGVDGAAGLEPRGAGRAGAGG